MKKRMLLVLLVLALVLPLLAFGESHETFTVYRGLLRGYSGYGGDVVIPETVDGETVKVFDLHFQHEDMITSLTLPDTLERLSSTAIYSMDALKSITLSQGLTFIGDHNFVFSGALEELDIPASVGMIGHSCFYDCASLRKITFRGPVPVIGSECFVDLPDDLVVYVPDDQLQEYLAALPYNLNVQPGGYNATVLDLTVPESELTFDAATGTLLSYTGSAALPRFPATVGGVPVKVIGANVLADPFYAYGVILPEGVEELAPEAFANANASFYRVTLPNSLRIIGDRAFKTLCSPDILWPDQLEYIGDESFMYSFIRQESIYLPAGLRYIGAKAFANLSSTKEVYFSSALEHVGEEAFNSSVTFIRMDAADLLDIAPNAFPGLTEIDISTHATRAQAQVWHDLFAQVGLDVYVWRTQNPDVEYAAGSTYENGLMTGYEGDLTNIRPWDSYDEETVGIAEGALKGNQIVRYFAACYNDKFAIIGAEAFADSVLETVDLFDSVTTIGNGAFRNCVNLREITLPDSVTFIGEGAFDGCTGLERVIVLCDPAVIPAGAFDSCSALTYVADREDANPVEVWEFARSIGISLPVSQEGLDRFCGDWYLYTVSTNGVMIPAADMGLEHHFILREDGTVLWDVQDPDEAPGIWMADAELLVIGMENTRVILMAEENTLVRYGNDGPAEVYAREAPQATYTPGNQIAYYPEDINGTWAAFFVDTDGIRGPIEVLGDQAEATLGIPSLTLEIRETTYRFFGTAKIFTSAFDLPGRLHLLDDGNMSMELPNAILYFQRIYENSTLPQLSSD